MKLELQSQQETEIYASDAGYVCIRQFDPLGEEVALILVRPDDIPTLVRHLRCARVVASEFRKEYVKSIESKVDK